MNTVYIVASWKQKNKLLEDIGNQGEKLLYCVNEDYVVATST